MEVNTMVENEVPNAIAINCASGTPAWGNKINSMGTIIVPPPMPNSPAKKPVTAPIRR